MAVMGPKEQVVWLALGLALALVMAMEQERELL